MALAVEAGPSDGGGMDTGVFDEHAHDPLGRVRSLSSAAGEVARVRTALAHRADLGACPGGRDCVALAHLAPGAPTRVRAVAR